MRRLSLCGRDALIKVRARIGALIRQGPGSAKSTVLMTLEDETEMASAPAPDPQRDA
jgi:hypothetical protein